MEVIHLYDKLSGIGGAESICVSIFEGFNNKKQIKNNFLCSFTKYNNIAQDYKNNISKENYIRFSPIYLLLNYSNAVYISHHRKITSLLIIFSKIFFKKLKVIHVAHNEFNNLKHLTFFPETIVAVSNRVKLNHKNYFGLNKVKVIYNGIKDIGENRLRINKKDTLDILLPGRITKIKQQVEIVRQLKGKLNQNIRILFAGDGPMYNLLIEEISTDKNFTALGHVDKMDNLYSQVDFVLLFSQKEGLPLSLIEATSYGIPCICNDVGGNTEVVINGINGRVINTFDELAVEINKLVNIEQHQYESMCRESRKIFEKHFSYDKMIDDYFDLVNECYGR